MAEEKTQKRYKIPDINTTWITEGITKDTVKWANIFGHYLADENVWADENATPIQKKDRDGKPMYYNGKPELEKNKPLSTTQLRKFFGEIKRVQISTFAKEKNSVLMLMPKLAYAVGKENGKGKIVDFYHQLSKALEAIDLQDDEKGAKHFDNFVNILEAIVAFHREKGGE
jgi:CRISPR type III-A-associated protein Csm2